MLEASGWPLDLNARSLEARYCNFVSQALSLPPLSGQAEYDDSLRDALLSMIQNLFGPNSTTSSLAQLGEIRVRSRILWPIACLTTIRLMPYRAAPRVPICLCVSLVSTITAIARGRYFGELRQESVGLWLGGHRIATDARRSRALSPSDRGRVPRSTLAEEQGPRAWPRGSDRALQHRRFVDHGDDSRRRNRDRSSSSTQALH